MHALLGHPSNHSGRMKTFATALVLGVILSDAEACTICSSGMGAAVRAGIFNSDFWSNLLLVMAPFIGTFGILAIAFAVPWGRGRSHPTESNSPDS